MTRRTGPTKSKCNISNASDARRQVVTKSHVRRTPIRHAESPRRKCDTEIQPREQMIICHLFRYNKEFVRFNLFLVHVNY